MASEARAAADASLTTETGPAANAAAQTEAQARTNLTTNGGLATKTKAQAGAHARLTTQTNTQASAHLDSNPGLNREACLSAQSQTDLAPKATGWFGESEAGHEPTGTALPTQAATRLTEDPSTEVCGDIGQSGSRVTRHDGAGVLRNKRRRITGVGHEARVGRRREAELVGHRQLDRADRVAVIEDKPRHRTSRRGKLFRRHVDQPGIGHGLPRSRHEGLRGFLVAKQAQDVVDKRGQRGHGPSLQSNLCSCPPM
ncbi:hypothetical protein AWC15_21865 [Mycobacterium lacus]|uniref:Uncharacterized protein n=1 Tax=Mycobacterium lacus TaxID=169765 RepID=A0A1X1Y5Q7_9MYCO|nr:hypothetical protein AWC15_21865 [Mycobacterium lacus]BBX98549.1 hypothetical protein MLAC_38430 [Mycobacterium lacus]